MVKIKSHSRRFCDTCLFRHKYTVCENFHNLRAIRRSRLVGRLGLVALLGFVGLLRLVAGLALVLHISNIARVLIGNGVVDSLGATVGEENPVGALGAVAIALLLLAKVERATIGIVVLNTVSVLVVGGTLLVLRLLVAVVLGLGLLVAVVGKGNGGQGKDDEVLKDTRAIATTVL